MDNHLLFRRWFGRNPGYKQFTFTFVTNGTFTAKTAMAQFKNEWEIRNNDRKAELRLDIDADRLESIEENWKVMNFGTRRVKLRSSSGGNPTYLTFERP